MFENIFHMKAFKEKSTETPREASTSCLDTSIEFKEGSADQPEPEQLKILRDYFDQKVIYQKSTSKKKRLKINRTRRRNLDAELDDQQFIDKSDFEFLIARIDKMEAMIFQFYHLLSPNSTTLPEHQIRMKGVGTSYEEVKEALASSGTCPAIEFESPSLNDNLFMKKETDAEKLLRKNKIRKGNQHIMPTTKESKTSINQRKIVTFARKESNKKQEKPKKQTSKPFNERRVDNRDQSINKNTKSKQQSTKINSQPKHALQGKKKVRKELTKEERARVLGNTTFLKERKVSYSMIKLVDTPFIRVSEIKKTLKENLGLGYSVSGALEYDQSCSSWYLLIQSKAMKELNILEHTSMNHVSNKEIEMKKELIERMCTTTTRQGKSQNVPFYCCLRDLIKVLKCKSEKKIIKIEASVRIVDGQKQSKYQNKEMLEKENRAEQRNRRLKPEL
ncbi:hypothetical protein NUSPORA_01412 [Nucleospora cyclopteri]